MINLQKANKYVLKRLGILSINEDVRVYLQDVYTVFTFKRKLYILNRNSYIGFQEKGGNRVSIHVPKIVGSALVLWGSLMTGYRYETEEALKAVCLLSNRNVLVWIVCLWLRMGGIDPNLFWHPGALSYAVFSPRAEPIPNLLLAETSVRLLFARMAVAMTFFCTFWSCLMWMFADFWKVSSSSLFPF